MNKIRNCISLARPVMFKSFLLALMLVMGFVTPASARAETFTDNVRVPFDLLVFVPCAAGGAGEEVQLSGSLHILFVTTFNDAGGFHSKYHFQPQGVHGYGLTTGARYQATGVTQGTFNGTAGFTDTYVNNFKIIGQGPGNNFLIHENFHFTINANGQATVSVTHSTAKCK